MDNKRNKIKDNKSTKGKKKVSFVKQKKKKSKQTKKCKKKVSFTKEKKKNSKQPKTKQPIKPKHKNNSKQKQSKPKHKNNAKQTQSKQTQLKQKQSKQKQSKQNKNIGTSKKPAKKRLSHTERDMMTAKKRLSQRINAQKVINDHQIESDESESTDMTDSSSDDESFVPKRIKVPQIVSPQNVAFAPFSRPQTAKYMKYSKQPTHLRPKTTKHSNNSGKQSPFSGCRRIHHSRHQSASLMKIKNKYGTSSMNDIKNPPMTSYFNKVGSNPALFHNYKITKQKRKHQKEVSYFDDTQSVMSELSTVNVNGRRTPRFNHSFKDSILSNIDGPFNILPQLFADAEEKQLFFPELIIDDENEEKNYMEHTEQNFDEMENELNIIIEVPINPGPEIFGNFLGALCGLCVPALDVVSSLDAAETYQLLSQYAANIDEAGNAHTLLLYEQLDGVSLFDLKQQLQVAEISLNYSHNENNDSSTTTQERIQRYFVTVVRKTFGVELPSRFSSVGRSMIRDAGFLFAVDMFLFNVSRFPVLLPFEGKGDADKLFISQDEDGDSVLYGLCNRFMGGHDIIDMPDYLVNGILNDNDNSIKLLLRKQRKYTNKYIERLEQFLCVLCDYYETKILPTIGNMNDELLHGLPSNKNLQNISSKKSQLESKITHRDCIDLCLRPIANYLYIHCGFELIIIDEYNKKSFVDSDDETVLKELELYRYKLIDNMITLLCEGILIGISQISEEIGANDIDTIIQDIKALDQNMSGVQLISSQFLKVVLKLFHSASMLFELNIEDSSSDEDYDDD